MTFSIGLPERTFHAAVTRPPSARAVSDLQWRSHIRRVWEANWRCYGSHRIWRVLQREGHRVARCTVHRLMAVEGIRGVQRGTKQWTTVADPAAARPADLVERRFRAERPNQLWLADLTYASTWQGWLYVAFILDVHSRTIVGWQLADHLRTDLVLDALEMAIWRRDLTAGDLVHHSAHGCQYTSLRYTERLLEAGIAASMGSVGDSYDCDDDGALLLGWSDPCYDRPRCPCVDLSTAWSSGVNGSPVGLAVTA